MEAGLPLSMCVPKNLGDLVATSAGRFELGSRVANVILPLDYVEQAFTSDLMATYLMELEEAKAQGLRNKKLAENREELEGKCPPRPLAMSLKEETDGSEGDGESEGDSDSEDEPLAAKGAAVHLQPKFMIDETALSKVKPGNGSITRVSMRTGEYLRSFPNQGQAITTEMIETRGGAHPE